MESFSFSLPMFQAYTSTLPGDCKETITWARFESADINDPAFFPDCTSDTVLPLILILGYNTGVQVIIFSTPLVLNLSQDWSFNFVIFLLLFY